MSGRRFARMADGLYPAVYRGGETQASPKASGQALTSARWIPLSVHRWLLYNAGVTNRQRRRE